MKNSVREHFERQISLIEDKIAKESEYITEQKTEQKRQILYIEEAEAKVKSLEELLEFLKELLQNKTSSIKEEQ